MYQNLSKILAGLTILAFVATGTVQAQSGVYIKLGDIQGEVAAGAYADWVEAISFDTEWNQPQSAATGTGRARVSIDVGDIIVRKSIDAATPKLMQHAATGKIVKNGTIVLVRNGKAILKYELTNVRIDAYSIIADAADTIEEVALQFDEFEVTYLPNSRSPYSNAFKWDLQRGSR